MNPIDQIRNETQQEPHGYYYAPLTEGGTFQKLGEEGSRMLLAAGQMWFTGRDPQLATQSSMGGLGDFVSSIGGALGQYVDNTSTIEQNLSTLINQLNDPRTWMAPTPFD
jgi:hypothetical protein